MRNFIERLTHTPTDQVVLPSNDVIFHERKKAGIKEIALDKVIK